MRAKSFIQKLLITGIFLLAFNSGYSQEPKTLTLDEAIDIAIKNNPEIETAKLEVKKAEAQVREAFGYALPTVNVNANLSHFIKKPVMPFPSFDAILNNAVYGVMFQERVPINAPNGQPMDEQTFRQKLMPIETELQSFALANSYDVTAEVSQILFNSAVFRGIGVSQTYKNVSLELLNSKIASTKLNTKKAFYGVILTKNMLEITRESFENARENLENVQAMREQGLVSEFDALQAEVRVENIRPQVLQMENALKNSKDGLKMAIGMDPQEEIDVTGEIEYNEQDIPEPSQAIRKAMESNYDVKSLEQKQEVDEAVIDVEKAAYYPNLAAFGNYSFAGQADDLNFKDYQQSMIGLNFSINIFQGNRTKNKVQQQRIEYQKTAEQIKQLKDAISMQIKTKINELERVKSNIEAQERNVDVAQRAYEIAQTRYQEGEGTQLEVQNADMALRQAKTNLLQSYYDWIVANSELEKLMGDIY